jgi:hypothetical protein
MIIEEVQRHGRDGLKGLEFDMALSRFIECRA